MAKVILYKTTTCPYCKLETQYLKEKGIQFEEIFVDHDEVAAKRMIEESGQMGVPFTEITKDDGIEVKILGFNRDKLNQALGITS